MQPKSIQIYIYIYLVLVLFERKGGVAIKIEWNNN